jgi:hypothetical protein
MVADAPGEAGALPTPFPVDGSQPEPRERKLRRARCSRMTNNLQRWKIMMVLS